ncbi:MAG TPA: MgtC/SapB family protein [Acidobacteriaceae bacterium]
MPITLTWEQIALRLTLAVVASFFIGLNRDERGRPAGLRTVMLVCLAATFAMLQVNLLLPLAGRPGNSFVMNDLMRLPLGILSGIGFIGAGVIFKRDNQLTTGVTTAATLWYVTVLGLLFGGGQLRTGCVAAVLAIVILWGLQRIESLLPREHHGDLTLTLDAAAPSEEDLRRHILAAGCNFSRWSPIYNPAATLSSLQCTVHWRERAFVSPHTPAAIAALRTLPGVRSVSWSE